MRSWAQEFISYGKEQGFQVFTSLGHISKSSQQGGKNATRILMNSPHPKMHWPYPKENL